jgi:hypothetical protein
MRKQFPKLILAAIKETILKSWLLVVSGETASLFMLLAFGSWITNERYYNGRKRLLKRRV